MGSLPWLAILIGAVAAFAVGAVWYGPIFGKAWQKEIGLTEDDIKDANMPMLFGGTFLLTAIIAIVMAMTMEGDLAEMTVMGGAVTGAIMGIGFGATVLGINYMYGRKSMNLWLIDAGYMVLVFAVIGTVLGAMGG